MPRRFSPLGVSHRNFRYPRFRLIVSAIAIFDIAVSAIIKERLLRSFRAHRNADSGDR